jgi:hypothetical protein
VRHDRDRVSKWKHGNTTSHRFRSGDNPCATIAAEHCDLDRDVEVASMCKNVASRARIMLSRFRASRSGNVAIIFAPAVLPLFAFMGAAVDYSLAAQAKARLSAAPVISEVGGFVGRP